MISALMITGKTPFHKQLARRAVDCFHNQSSVGAKELVIINTAIDAPWFRGEPLVREVCVEPKYSLGQLRNISFQHATGDIWVQWDDDDWHHPDRLRLQTMQRLSKDRVSKNLMVLLRCQLRVDIKTWEARVVTGEMISKVTTGIVGTMAHPALTNPELSKIRYPDVGKGEDASLLRQWLAGSNRYVHVVGNHPQHYVRLYHGSNTWDRKHIMQPGRVTHEFDGDLIPKLRAIYNGLDFPT